MPKGRKGKVVENRVARRYSKAGFKVFIRKIVRGVGEFDILAKRGRKLLAIEVKHSSKRRLITSTDVEKPIKKARSIRAKPVLILSGKSTLSYPGKELVKKCKVKIKKL